MYPVHNECPKKIKMYFHFFSILILYLRISIVMFHFICIQIEYRYSFIFQLSVRRLSFFLVWQLLSWCASFAVVDGLVSTVSWFSLTSILVVQPQLVFDPFFVPRSMYVSIDVQCIGGSHGVGRQVQPTVFPGLCVTGTVTDR